MPRVAASILVRSVIQSALSMKIDNNASDESLQSAEFSLLQLANMINNAAPFENNEQVEAARKAFDPNYEPGPPDNDNLNESEAS